MTRRRWFGLGVAATCAVLLWRPWQAPPAAPPDAQWLALAPQPLERRLGLLGRIEPARREAVVAPFAGVLQALPVPFGARVEAGQPLARLDTAQLDIQLRQAEAEALKARRALAQLQGWASGPEVARAKRALARARRTLALSQAALAEAQGLFDAGIIARLEVDNLAEQVAAQVEALKAAEAELRLIQAQGQGELLHIAGMESANAQAHHAGLLALRAQAVLRAPFAGLLAPPRGDGRQPQQQVRVGQQVSAGMPLLELVELDHLQVVAQVEQGDVQALRIGMPVHISAAGFAGELHGRIASLSLQASENQGQGAWFDLRVALDETAEPIAAGVRLGMTVHLSVLLYRNEQGIAVPEQVLRSDAAGGQYVEFRANEQQAPRRVPVVVRGVVGQGVEVEGLQAGQVRVR